MLVLEVVFVSVTIPEILVVESLVIPLTAKPPYNTNEPLVAFTDAVVSRITTG